MLALPCGRSAVSLYFPDQRVQSWTLSEADPGLGAADPSQKAGTST